MTFGDLIISLHLDNLHFFPLMAQIDYEANHSAGGLEPGPKGLRGPKPGLRGLKSGLRGLKPDLRASK